ncbi:MAG: arginine--tRNA ligase [Candidatus Nanopelagicales bacterium]
MPVTPAELADVIVSAVSDAVAAGEIALAADQVPGHVALERPKNQDHGDYATNIAMRLAKPAGMPPRTIAEAIAFRLRPVEGIASVDVAGPGFLNLTLDAAAAGVIAAQVVEAGEEFGRVDTLAGQSFNVEFISANPTGPLHLGHTRWAAVGDAIAAVLSAAGAKADREFYVNDRGVQMDLFGASIQAAALGRPIPENGYQGAYIQDIADHVVAADQSIMELPADEQMVAFREAGYGLQLAQQQGTLDRFRTHFDTWASERALHESGAVERALAKLREQGHVFESDGAVWLRTTEFGDDKDRVLIKADGQLTYFMSDCAYYVDKRERGFTTCLYLLGADHHGYVNRLKAVSACAGDDPSVAIEVLIGQMVKTMRDGVEVKLSKRAGEIVTLSDLVDEVGVDAARYTLIRYPADSPLVMDLGLLVKRTNDNPVYYVQYAHARISSVLRNAAEMGIDWRNGSIPFDPAVLSNERESALIGAVAEFPRVVASAAELREPHRIARYLEDLANSYHRFYDVCRVLPRGDEPVDSTHVGRLWLCAAARQTLSNGLEMLGVTAPERM